MKLEGKLLEELQLILNAEPEAVRFFLEFNAYCHYIDNLIDGEIERTPENILKLCIKAAALYTSNFYHKYSVYLYPIVIQITNEYADSVMWLDANEEWKAKYRDVLRHCGNNMLMVIIGIIAGYDKLREISPLIREVSYEQHHSKDGIPI